MNICMIYWYYLPNYGGIQTIMQTMALELKKHNYNVFILCGSNKGSPRHEIMEGIDITRTVHLSRKIKTNQKDRVRFLNNYIKKNKIDILHVNNFQRPHATYHTEAVYKVALENNIPVILHIHIPIKKKKEIELINKYNWDVIISISKFIGKGIKVSKKKRKKIKNLPNCIDPKKFNKNKIPKKYREELRRTLHLKRGKPIVLMPTRLLNSKGQFEERKGIKEFINVAAKCKGQDFYGLITALEHESFPKKNKDIKKLLRNLSKKLGIEKKIIIPKENIKQKLMPALYSMSDIVLIPSVDEAFGIVVLEGMASGKPVIGTTSGALPEIIVHKKTGLLTKPKSERSLANALVRLLKNKKLAKKLGKNGKKRVKEKYSNKAIIEKLIKIYKEAKY